MRNFLLIMLLLFSAIALRSQTGADNDAPTACDAMFSAEPDPMAPLTLRFQDQSTGKITLWQWNFGDGSTTTGQHPVHTYAQEGTYFVCLTVSNADTGFICYDFHCILLVVQQPAMECHALFTAALDSLNKVPNTFIFTNESTGEPTDYLWTFDNGAYYTTENVVHHFATPGQHRVCLNIEREVQGVVVCSDSVCRTVETQKYADIGGHLFTGAYPINNPISTGDTGAVYLYRVENKNIVLYDSARFTELGYYAFPARLVGNYIVRAALTAGSHHRLEYFPGYYNQSLTWKESTVLSLTETNAYISDIFLAPTGDNQTGSGIISGRVVNTVAGQNQDAVPQAAVVVYDPELRPCRYAISDSKGGFAIDRLPYGLYHLYVDYPGMYSRLTDVWLDATVPSADSLVLELFGHDVTSLPEIPPVAFIAGELYPNPATNMVTLNLRLASPDLLRFELRSLTGVKVWSGSEMVPSGRVSYKIPLDRVPRGMYVLVLTTGNGHQAAVKKLVRY
jgi:PKD repeat protein